MHLFNGGMGVWSGLGVALIALGATGCGGGDDKPSGGPSADFSGLHEAYLHPSGTLSKGDKKAIIAGLDGQNASSSVQVMSAKLGGSRGPGAHVLDDAPFACGTPSGGSTTQTCACNGGGTVKIGGSANQDGSGAQSSLTYDDCKYSSGTSSVIVDGTLEYAEISNPPPLMIIYKEHLTETVTPPGDKVSIDLSYALVNGVATYSVDVGDGNVLIQANGSWDSTTKSGSFTVITKDGSTSCKLTNGEGSCTGAGGSVEFS